MWSRFAVLLASAIAVAQARPMAQADAFFSFHSNAWLNLHHILWSRGEGAPLPADLPEAERTAWAAGIEFYAPYSRRNLISDDELIAIKEALRNMEGRTSLDERTGFVGRLPIDVHATEQTARPMSSPRRQPYHLMLLAQIAWVGGSSLQRRRIDARRRWRRFSSRLRVPLPAIRRR